MYKDKLKSKCATEIPGKILNSWPTSMLETWVNGNIFKHMVEKN